MRENEIVMAANDLKLITQMLIFLGVAIGAPSEERSGLAKSEIQTLDERSVERV